MDNPQPEPSMEEILASIRRIISEDEEEAAPAQSAPHPGQRAAPSKPALVETAAQTPEQPSSPVQTSPAVPQRREGDGAHTRLETEDVEMIKKNMAAAIGDDAAEAILDTSSADAASSAFEALSQTVRVTETEGPGRTLEDIVIAMLRPMVKDWLDANLPAIVEEKVEEEVQRVARRRR